MGMCIVDDMLCNDINRGHQPFGRSRDPPYTVGLLRVGLHGRSMLLYVFFKMRLIIFDFNVTLRSLQPDPYNLIVNLKFVLNGSSLNLLYTVN